MGLSLFLSSALSLQAHIGSPTVFFEGPAGPYQARITVRPPEVIPGLATVNVRVFTPGVKQVTALPMRWNTGRQGAPPPDKALPVRGETNLYSTELWFMQGGSQSVEVEISGDAGTGRVVLPFNAVATRVLGMPRSLGYVLGAMGCALVLLLVSIVGAAVRESILPPGISPSNRRLWLARGAALLSAIVIVGLGYLGKRWWDLEAADYRNNRLYQPLSTHASVYTTNGHPMLRLELIDEAFRRGAPLVPDHGKLMHLFLVREPGLDVLGHLHPRKIEWDTFETALPALPEGRYTLYADVTSETGFSDTLTTQFTLDKPLTAPTQPDPALIDPDDSWRIAPPLGTEASGTNPVQKIVGATQTAYQMEWLTPGPLIANRDLELRFRFRDASGHAAQLDPYLGMAGHLVLRRDDGTVFTHLHPGGSFSMAAQQLFAMRGDGRAPLKVAPATKDPLCRLPTLEELELMARSGGLADLNQGIGFPYAFPKPGRYRIWVQVKLRGEVVTGVFDAEVLSGS